MLSNINRALNAAVNKLAEQGYSGSVGQYDNNFLLTLVKGCKAIGNYELFIYNRKFKLVFYRKDYDQHRELISWSLINGQTPRLLYEVILKDVST